MTGAAPPEPAAAGGVDAVVRGSAGKPAADAVVYAMPLSGTRVPTARPARGVIDQQDKEFVPHVKPIQVGTPVVFPNKDDIRHHVYSFSPAKKFELPLYKGVPAAPVTFDRAGVVVLGCNIHDWMLGYVFVVETPYFGATDADGKTQLRDLPPGSYEVRVWHPRLAADPGGQRVSIAGSGVEQVEYRIVLKPEWRPRRAPAPGGDSYR